MRNIAVGILFLCCLQATSGLKDAIWTSYFRLGLTIILIVSPLGLLDLETIVIAVEISFLSCLPAEIEVYPVLETAILDFSLLVKSYKILGSFIG